MTIPVHWTISPQQCPPARRTWSKYRSSCRHSSTTPHAIHHTEVESKTLSTSSLYLQHSYTVLLLGQTVRESQCRTEMETICSKKMPGEKMRKKSQAKSKTDAQRQAKDKTKEGFVRYHPQLCRHPPSLPPPYPLPLVPVPTRHNTDFSRTLSSKPLT